MINITNTPIGLLKYHINKTVDDHVVYVITTNSKEELKDCLLQSIAYKGMEIWPVLYIINYTGRDVVEGLLQSENNTAYIVVPKVNAWSKIYKKKEGFKFITIDPKLYEHNLEVLKYILTPKAYIYYWEYYCLERFNSNPFKWYNEVMYLTFLYKEKGSKFNCEDIDIIYNKVSNTVELYLENILSDNSKSYILNMSNRELFVTFIGIRKSLIESKILSLCPEKMMAFNIMRESFLLGKIRLGEAVVVLDFILKNKENNISIKQLRNLFGLL